MSDIVYIHGLCVDAVIGVHPWERCVHQQLVIDLDMACDAARAARSDAIEDALDYQVVAERVRELVAAGRYRLLEALAETVARDYKAKLRGITLSRRQLEYGQERLRRQLHRGVARFADRAGVGP